MSETSRREFVKTAALSTGVAGAPAVRTAWGRESPNNRVNLGVIGFRGRGGELYREFAHLPDVRVAYLCDVDERLFAPMVAEVEQIGGYKPETFFDMRKLLEKKDLDAVVDRHARPLARAGDDLGLPGRQGRLRGEARLPQPPRGPQDGGGGAQVQPHRAGRAEPPQRSRSTSPGRVSCRRPGSDRRTAPRR